MLSVYVPSVGQPVTATYTGGVTVAVPLSCPDPCQFVLDGTTGTITLTWVDTTGHSQSVVVNIVAASVTTPSTPTPAVPPLRYVVANPVVGRGQLKPGLLTTLTTPASSGGASTGTKVAVAVAGTSVLALVVMSVAGWGIGRTLDRAYDKITGKKPSRR
jgi:hypothetical protein